MSTTKVKLMTVSLFLFFGTLATFAYKLQGSVHVKEGQQQKKFFHPYMQCLTMFIGQACCLIVYLYYKNAEGSQQTSSLQQKQPYSKMIFLVPALADSISTTLQYMGLNFISVSTFMMLKGSSIVSTAIFSRILIKMKLQRWHLLGCGLAIVGVMIVGASSIVGNQENSEKKDSNDHQLIGYVLMLISLIFNGFFYAYEQYLMKKHTINPLEMVGYEGVFGIIIVSVIVTILSFIPCHFGPSLCVYSSDNQPFMQLPSVFFKQIFSDFTLLLLLTIGITSIGIYNLNGLRITKLFDALTRSLLNISKTSIIWIVGLAITLIWGMNNKDLRVESLELKVNGVKIMGFATIIFGTLIYNRLIGQEWFTESQGDGAEQQKKSDKEFNELIQEKVIHHGNSQ